MHVHQGLLPNPLGDAADYLRQQVFGRRIVLPDLFAIRGGTGITAAYGAGGFNLTSSAVAPDDASAVLTDNAFGHPREFNQGPAVGDLQGWYPSPTVHKSSTDFGLTAVLSVTINADFNDYNPAGLSTVTRLRVDVTGAISPRTITGIAGGYEGRLLVVTNSGGIRYLKLANDSASSSAVNRMHFPEGDITLFPGTSVTLEYDGVNQYWRKIGDGRTSLDQASVASGGGSGRALSLDGSSLPGYRLTQTLRLQAVTTETIFTNCSAYASPDYEIGAGNELVIEAKGNLEIG